MPQSKALAAAASPSSPSRVGLPPSTAVSASGRLRTEPSKNGKQSEGSGGGTVDGNQKVQKSLDFVSAKLGRIDPEGPRDSDDVHSAVRYDHPDQSGLWSMSSAAPAGEGDIQDNELTVMHLAYVRMAKEKVDLSNEGLGPDQVPS